MYTTTSTRHQQDYYFLEFTTVTLLATKAFHEYRLLDAGGQHVTNKACMRKAKKPIKVINVVTWYY